MARIEGVTRRYREMDVGGRKNSATFLLIFVSLLLVILPVFGIERCQLQTTSFTNIPTFRWNGVKTALIINKILVKPFTDNPNDTECFIEISDLLAEEVNFTGNRLRAYAFGCKTPMKLTINGTHIPYPEIISYTQLQGCEMGVDSLSVIANVTTLTVLNIVARSTLTSSSDPAHCSALDGIGTLLISNQRFPSLDMDVFFACKDHLSFMAEMSLSNLSLTTLPQNLSRFMPTLQGLDLRMNNFTTPPVFPWDNTTRNLPLNLSRTIFLQTHYTYGTVQIPNNEYRREYRLDNNPHLNLTGYTFRGYLHILSIANCNLKSVRYNEFYEVEGLQYLSLAWNKIEYLPHRLFSWSNFLRKLELQGNQLKDLTPGVFEGLKYLTRLNLAQNELTTLKEGIFDGLLELEKLDLHNNKLTSISRGAFSELLMKLKVINLENNPLTYLPEGLLLLRGLYDIRMQGNNITDLDLTRIDRGLQFDKFKYTVVDSVSTANPDIDIPSDGLRKVDLSGGHIRTLSFTQNDKYSAIKIALLLKHYKFILEGNPIRCDCHLLNFTRYVRELVENGTIGNDAVTLSLYGTEFAFKNWKCAEPEELKFREVLRLNDEETYCPLKTPQCPNNCTCYIRSVLHTNIVDCRNVGLTEAPKTLPVGDTELWLQDNMISQFSIGKQLSSRLIELHLERNNLEKLNPSCLAHMANLRILYIQNNLLANIPKEIQNMDLKVIKLGGNPLQCDCHSLWMKKWLLRNYDVVADFNDVKCVNNVEDTGTNILKVKDEDFICEEVPIYKIAAATAVPTTLVIVFLIIILLLFIYWDDFKVFLYVHTGIHPFDKKDPGGVMCYDAFVAYPSCLADWAHENIVLQLKQNFDYKIYDVAMDFKFGQSLQENIQHGAQLSRRMILIISEDSHTDPLMQLATEAALEKSREEKANFIVPILYNITPRDIDNEQLQKYFKAKKFVSNNNDHFIKRLVYHMPTTPIAKQVVTRTNYEEVFNETVVDVTDSNVCMDDDHKQINGCNANGISPQTAYPQPDVVMETRAVSTVFVWYADSDFTFMMDRIVNPFEAEGHNFILSDKSFLPGAAIQENILHAIEDSDRTIIILSKDSLVDEWTLYVFRFANERQMVDKSFLMGLVVREGMIDNPCDEEIVKHLLTYQPLSEKDSEFHKKIQDFIKPSKRNLRQTHTREQLHNSDTKL